MTIVMEWLGCLIEPASELSRRGRPRHRSTKSDGQALTSGAELADNNKNRSHPRETHTQKSMPHQVQAVGGRKFFDQSQSSRFWREHTRSDHGSRWTNVRQQGRYGWCKTHAAPSKSIRSGATVVRNQQQGMVTSRRNGSRRKRASAMYTRLSAHRREPRTDVRSELPRPPRAQSFQQAQAPQAIDPPPVAVLLQRRLSHSVHTQVAFRLPSRSAHGLSWAARTTHRLVLGNVAGAPGHQRVAQNTPLPTVEHSTHARQERVEAQSRRKGGEAADGGGGRVSVPRPKGCAKLFVCA